MRRTYWLAAALVAFPLAGSADDFSQFRIPDHYGHQYILLLATDAFRSSNVAPGDAGTHGALIGGVNASGYWFHDADPAQWVFSVHASLYGDRTHRTDDRESPLPEMSEHIEERGRLAVEAVGISGAYRGYPVRVPLALQLAAAATFSNGQAWNLRSDLRTQRIDSTTYEQSSASGTGRWGYNRTAVVSAGAGWGRVRDASTVYAVWLLERRWLRDGALARPLSESARLRLAQLLSIRGDYGVVHDRPEKAFWRDVEKLLRDEGALAGDRLDAWALEHALEPLANSGGALDRLTGFFAGPSVGFTHEHMFARTELTSSADLRADDTPIASVDFRRVDKSTEHSDPGFAAFGAEYHRPIGLTTQLDVTATASCDVRGVRRSSAIDSRASVRWWLAERWTAGWVTTQDRSIARRGGTLDSWTVGSSASLDYWLEDRWTVGASAGLSRSVLRNPDRTDRRDASLQVGMGWNRGALDAPGLIAPVRPLN